MEATITEFFQQYAASPGLVYGAVALFMLASAFGFPCPEEVILISAGLVGYASLTAIDLPPEARINPYFLAVYCFLVVIASDFLIYTLGKHVANPILRSRFFARLIRPGVLEKIELWIKKYSYGAVFLFRFTPGVRFPGHLMCGAMGLSRWKFLAVDFIAAGISVPTQVLLVAFYGKDILAYLQKFKIYFFSTLAIGLVIYLIYKFTKAKQPAQALATSITTPPSEPPQAGVN